jgi:DNA-binding beta-propeller fold protein YncE
MPGDSEPSILRLNLQDLTADREYAAGADVERMFLSYDGGRLYALLGGADTVLMMDADSGEWLMSAPVGVSPRDMRLDKSGKRLAVAGGASGSVLVLDAENLETQAEYPVEGTAVGAFFAADGLVTLSESADYEPYGIVGIIPERSGEYEAVWELPGMPSSFAMGMNGLLVGHMNTITLLNLQHRETRWRMIVQGLPDNITPIGRLACYMDRLTGRVGAVDCFQPTLMSVIRKAEPAGLAYL